MASDYTTPLTKRNPGTTPPQQGDVGPLLSTGVLDKKGKPIRRAVQTIDQAKLVLSRLVEINRRRHLVAARILAKYNSERPYDPDELEKLALSWRQNFSSKAFASLVERVFPRLSEAVHAAKYLTSATLSNKWVNSTQKSEFFQAAISNFIRSQPDWTSLIDNLALDVVLFGYSALIWTDPTSWWPVRPKHNELFFPDGTKQDPELIQLFAIRETFLPHELFQVIEDREAAEAAGWKIPAVIEAINKACPAQLRNRLASTGQAQIWYEEANRHLNLVASYVEGANVVAIYTLFVREVTGKVSVYRFAEQPNLELIFEHDDYFSRMSDCLALFTYQHGLGTIHSSKGIGRDVYELTTMIDRTRCEIVDRAILSGKTFWQGDPRRLNTFRMSLIGNAVLVPAGWAPLEVRIDGNVEPLLRLDAYFARLADQLVGAITEPHVGGEAFRSPEAWRILAARQEEVRDAKITRWLTQVARAISTLQRKLCDPEILDKKVKDFQKSLQEVLSKEELEELANTPAITVVRDLTPVERQLISMVAAEKRGHPLYNQRQLEVEDLVARVGIDFANRVLLPDEDQTVQVEAARQQQLENVLLMANQQVMVSPRDNHLIHLEMLKIQMQALIPALQQRQISVNLLINFLAHYESHVTAAAQAGANKAVLAPHFDFLKQAAEVVKNLLDAERNVETLGAVAATSEAEHEAQAEGLMSAAAAAYLAREAEAPGSTAASNAAPATAPAPTPTPEIPS